MVMSFLVAIVCLLCVFYLDLVVKCCLLNVEIDYHNSEPKPMVKDSSPQDKVGKV
jgi:hypothetical protein